MHCKSLWIKALLNALILRYAHVLRFWYRYIPRDSDLLGADEFVVSELGELRAQRDVTVHQERLATALVEILERQSWTNNNHHVNIQRLHYKRRWSVVCMLYLYRQDCPCSPAETQPVIWRFPCKTHTHTRQKHTHTHIHLFIKMVSYFIHDVWECVCICLFIYDVCVCVCGSE